MAGNTSRIDLAILRIQWASHSSYAAICSYWTVSRDQIIRLKQKLPLPPRHDRRLRFRPERYSEPSAEEIAASETSLNLAPLVAERVTCVTSLWTEDIRHQRQVTKPQGVFLSPVEMPDDMDDGDDFRW